MDGVTNYYYQPAPQDTSGSSTTPEHGIGGLGAPREAPIIGRSSTTSRPTRPRLGGDHVLKEAFSSRRWDAGPVLGQRDIYHEFTNGTPRRAAVQHPHRPNSKINCWACSSRCMDYRRMTFNVGC